MRWTNKKICIGLNPHSGPNGGGKARIDAVDIARKLGYELFPLSCIGDSIHIKHFHPILEIFNAVRFNRLRDNIIFIQYPFSLGILDLYAFKKIARYNKTILLSHDLEFLRNGRNCNDHEKQILNSASCVISHNSQYSKALKEAGINTPLINLGLFDYLVSPINQDIVFTNTVSFIGNLSKSMFLREWASMSRSYTIELIGSLSKDQDIEFSESCIYGGVFPPDIVPSKIRGSFGLVWDGDSVETCHGNLGQYLKYNNPHKFSLYIAASKPVFVWTKSALADFVLSNGIGFAIERLDDIDDLLSEITVEKYAELVRNIRSFQAKITGRGVSEECYIAS